MASAKDFVHLHVHSHFSLLDGAISIPKLVGAAKECGMRALALTDHGNLFGALQFYRKCRSEGVKPIIGMEAYIAPGSRLDKRRTAQGAFFHFTLLARDEEGYRNLMRLSSIAYIDGFYYKPRIDKEVLREHAAGLIGMSACLSSEINRAALNGTDDELREQIRSYRDIFAEDCFFLEIQRNGLPEQERIIERIPPLGKEIGVPLVATNDIHYLRREDARAQEVHLCINTGQTMDDSDRMRFSSDQFYFRNKDEMHRVLGAEHPDALENTVRIAEMCDLKLDFSKTHLPPFEFDGAGERGETGSAEAAPERPAPRESAESLFRRLCVEGCRRHYPDEARWRVALERLEHEIGVIKKMGYINYFLITWDFINFARQNGIPVGPGRGSAAGSIVAYALGITNVDPLEYDLLFERFLNAERISMPDIDIDFCMEGRERVIEYVRKKYGEDRVSQIITFGTMAARAVLRDVGRVLGIPLSDINAITQKIPAGPGVKLGESLEADPDLARARNSDPKIAELFDLALKLEGLNRHCSTHAAGVVIGDAPLIEMIPLYRNGEDITSQWTMDDLELAGMLKMDFLGLRTLTIIDKCVKEIRRARGIAVDIDRIPLDDQATFDMLCRGDTTAVFQLESNGMRDLMRRLKPDRFEDIIAVLALYRPGPIEGGMIDRYVERKHGREKIAYDHPVLEPILAETFGVILYQEQVMRIANKFAGFSLNEADSLRKAMGKKKLEIMQEFKAKFVSGAEANGHDAKKASHLFDLIEFFAGYGFNKSHSTAYALVTYQTAYLKANYPTEFMAAVLTCEMSNTEKIVEYIEECRQLGIDVLPPSIQKSLKGFSVEGGRIWYGLEAIKGIGGKIVDEIIAERTKNGEFRSIFDLAERTFAGKTVLDPLVFSGALDDFGVKRSCLHAVAEAAQKRGQEARKNAESRQATFDFLSAGPAGDSPSFDTYPDLPEWEDFERLKREKEALNFYISGHPIDAVRVILSIVTHHRIVNIAQLPDKTPVVIGALVTKLTKKVSKKSGENFWIAIVEDETGSQEIYIDKVLYDASQEWLVPNSVICLQGQVGYRDTTASLRVKRIVPLYRAVEELARDLSVIVAVDESRAAEDRLFQLKELLGVHHGSCPLYIILRKPSGERAVLEAGPEYRVRPDAEFLRAAIALLGNDAVLINRMARN